MVGPHQFPCFGIQAFGSCSYDPTSPANVYFGLGEAVAALAFTLAIQQFIKPIFVFRLRALGIRLWHLLFLVFSGFVCAIIAAVVPHIEMANIRWFSYPIFWELTGAILIGSAYTVVGFILVIPARVFDLNCVSFVRAGANLLSEADDDARVSFAKDILGVTANIERLFKYSNAGWKAERHDSTIEFDRRQSQGLPMQFSGRAPPSAFYRFTHRKELERGSFAASLLRIMSDPSFCSALVRKCPWLVATTLKQMAERELDSTSAANFVQEIARQSIIDDESMMAREVSYKGFRAAPILSQGLFSSWFILSHYRPFGAIDYDDAEDPSDGFLRRFTAASEMALKVAIEGKEFWHGQYFGDVREVYKNLFMRFGFRKETSRGLSIPNPIVFNVHSLHKILVRGFLHLDSDDFKNLFTKKKDEYRHDLIEDLASIIYESFSAIANRFSGPNDLDWHYAISTFMDVFPHSSTTPGLNPLQQRMTIKFIDKLQDNMTGWYPAMSRILLAVIGPYEPPQEQATRNGHRILMDAAYFEFQRLIELHEKKPEKVGDFLPQNVEFNAGTGVLTHTYRDGATRTANLRELRLPQIDLFDEAVWQLKVEDREQ